VYQNFEKNGEVRGAPPTIENKAKKKREFLDEINSEVGFSRLVDGKIVGGVCACQKRERKIQKERLFKNSRKLEREGG